MAEMTERLLVDAGIANRMRVLDAGCGRGDVSLLLARLVGERGEVLGVDRDPRTLDMARERVRDLGLTNVAFTEGDFAKLGAEHGAFDAAVGRRVLMYQADPVLALRGLARVLRPGAMVVFQEADATMVPASSVPLPLNARVNRCVTAGLTGYHFQRHRRYPGTHPVARTHTSAMPYRTARCAVRKLAPVGAASPRW